MPSWENDIFGKVDNADLITIGQQVPTRPNDPADALFGDEVTDNLVAKWQTIASEYQIPVMAQFHAFDTESQKAIRIPIDTHNIEKGLIKVKINQSERLRALTRTGVRDNELYNYVLDDATTLADQVITRTKIAKNEVLATGKMTIKENNLDIDGIDYGVPDENLNKSVDTVSTSDIFDQMQQIIDDATSKGVTIDTLYTGKKNITEIRNHPSVQKAINGANMVGARVTNTAFADFMEQEFGISRIITNDLTYALPPAQGADGRPIIQTKRYYPENKMTFLASNPAGRVGIGLWGETPEEDLSNMIDGGTSNLSPYVYITQWVEKDPAVLWTKASALFAPIIYNPSGIFVATVVNTGA